MPFLNSGELKIYYEMKGKGPRLLFLAGTFSDLRQNLQIFESPLAKEFEILTFDPRGIGQSNSPDQYPTMNDYANDVKRVLDHVGWKKCYCMGESFGGMVGQEFALNYPEYFEKLILVVTSSGGKGGSNFPYHEHNIANMSSEERADFLVRSGDKRYQDPSYQKTDLYKLQYETYLQVFKLNEKNPDRKQFSERQIYARKFHDTFDRLPNLKIPTYICGGRYDNTAPFENQIALWRQIPNARLTFFAGSHMILWQDPFAFRSIADFCNQTL